MSGIEGLAVVIVGGGFGGLSAAAHLSAAGARVTLIEQAAEVGGKAGRIEKDGFVFDTGPTLLTMPDVLRATFAAAGSDLDRAVPLSRLDPICRYVFDAGEELVVHADPEDTRRSLAALSAEDARRWDRFCVECKQIWEAAGEPYLEAPFDGYVGFTQRVLTRGARAVRVGMGLGTLDELARRHFTTEAMRRFVGRFATYAGASPYAASAAFAMIPHLEHTTGAWYPRGGMVALATALRAAIEARGVVVQTGTAVTSIDFDGARARGVTTASGSVAADAVVCGVDPLFTLEHLVPPAMARSAGVARLRARAPSLSGMAWLLGIEGPLPPDAHHTVLFARDYAEEFHAIFERGTVALDPTVYVAVPSLHDPTRAPAGHHAVFTLVNAPATGDTADWDAEARRVRDRILARLERSYCPGIGRRIVCEAFVTPREIGRTGSVGGAIYGAAPHGATAPFERPRNRAPFAKGLYFVGGATHPGGGVPMVALGGKFVAELVVADAARGRVERRTVRTLERAS